MGRKIHIATLALALTLVTGCSAGRWSSPGTCALIGAGLGVAGGMVYASTTDTRDPEDYGIGIGAGLAGGALLGWAWCALMDYTGTRAAAPARTKTVEATPPTDTTATTLATKLYKEPTLALAGN